MSIEKLNPHYSMNNPASIYDEESLSALELAGRTAAKMNEVVEATNEAYDYMKTNLEKNVDENIEEMAADGTLETKLVRAIASGKVDKGKNESITFNMLAQDVKEMFTGEQVPVVGENSVNSANITEKAVKERHLAGPLKDYLFYSTQKNIPLLIFNTSTGAVTVNPAFTDEFEIYAMDSYYSFNPSDISVDATLWNKSYYFKMFMNPSTKVITITPFNTPSINYEDCINLGRVAFHDVSDNLIPLEVNERYFCGKSQLKMTDAPNALKEVCPALHRYKDPVNAVFNVDRSSKEIKIVKGGNYNVMVMHQTITINFDTVTIDYSKVDFTKAVSWLYYDFENKKLIFMQSITDVSRNWYYFGMVYWNMPYLSTCVVPFLVDDTWYYHPYRVGREYATLIFNPYTYATKTLPYVDFTNNKLVFPSVNRLYLTTPEGYWNLYTGTGENIEVPFNAALDSYQFLVGSPEGLKFVNGTEFTNLTTAMRRGDIYYLGCCTLNGHMIDFTFDCVKGRSVSFLGDSISTFGGFIPEGNNPYYTDEGTANVNMMWWRRVTNRCGLILNTNNSNSGSRVTDTRSDGLMYGIEMCKNLDNGTAPEIIVIYLGINDYHGNVPLGTYNGKGPIPTDKTTFREGYAQMLHNVLTTYPKTKVYACTLPTIERTTGDISSPDKNNAGTYLMEYNDAIRELCRAFCVEVIDLESCGINHYNGKEYMWDFDESTGAFVHPNAEGHRLISHKVIKAITNSME